MTRIDVAEGFLHVEVLGWHKLWAFKSRLEFPLGHVKNVLPLGDGPWFRSGLRMPGTNLPGVITAGTYRVLGTGERNFWDVCRKEKALVFELRDEPYTRLIVEVEDPFTTIEKVRRAIDSQGMTRRSGNQRA